MKEEWAAHLRVELRSLHGWKGPGPSWLPRAAPARPSMKDNYRSFAQTLLAVFPSYPPRMIHPVAKYECSANNAHRLTVMPHDAPSLT